MRRSSRLDEGSLTRFGDHRFEDVHGGEEGTLELPDLARVDHEVVLAREPDDLAFDLRLVEVLAGCAAFGVDAGRGQERDIDADAVEEGEVVPAREGGRGR